MKKTTICLIWIFCQVCTAGAQLASYDFNSNIEDQVGGFHATSVGNLTIDNEEYASLEPNDYMLLPIALSTAIDNTKSLEIFVRFKVEGDWRATEDEEEVRIILSSKEDVYRGLGGFEITARQWEGQLRIMTTYGDDLIYDPGGCPTCCSTCIRSEGKLDFVSDIDSGIWYDLSIKFIFDEETPYIQYAVNNAISTSYYGEHVDYEGFRQTINQQQIAVGADLNNNIRFQDDPRLDLQIDHLTIASPVLPGDPMQVGTVLQTLTSYMNGEETLSELEIDSMHAVFVTNWDIQSYDENATTIHTYMSKYSEVYGPIFDQPFKESPDQFPPLEAIQYQMQQWILDNQYGTATVSQMEGLTFRDHELFPGEVSADAPRLTDAAFIVDADYKTDPGFVLNGQENAIRPTGYYVPPGELVTVTVPDAAIGQGLTLFVGAHRKNVQETWNEFTRFPRIGTEYEIDSKTITVANPFGGGIYVTIPDEMQLGALEFEVEGAVKAPFYSTKEGFTSSLPEFQEEIENTYVPWADMESANFMCTIPHGMAISMNNPDSVFSVWDQSFDAVNIALGRPLKRFRGEYLIVDRNSHVKFTAAPASYPMSLETVNFPYDLSGDTPINVAVGRDWYREVQGAFHYIILHEFGHLHNMPTLYHEQEANVQVPAAAVYNLVMGESIDSAFVYSVGQRLNFEQAALDWVLTPIFYKGYRMGLDTINYETFGDAIQMSYQSRGYAKLVDIAKMFGWESLGDIMGYFYDYKLQNPEWDPYNLQDDEFIEAASQVMGFNMAPHFEFWGILPSDELVERLETMPTSDVIKDRIIHFRSYVPGDNEDFLPIYNTMSNKLGPHHMVRYDAMKSNYDETIAEQIIARIDAILNRYYDIDETDYNEEPSVTGLVVPLSTLLNTPIILALSDFLVEDVDNDFPTDFTLTVFEGDNYSVLGTTITPDLGFTGELSVPVMVNDGLEDSEQYVAMIDVKATNEKPVITGIINPLSTPENTPITLSLTDFVVEDSDNNYPDDFTFKVYEGNNYSFAETTITPDADFIGEISIPISVNDGSVDSEQYLVLIDVIAVNEKPVIMELTTPLSTSEDTPIALSLTDFIVEDSDNDFPTDFSLTVFEGDNYSVSGKSVTPDLGFTGVLTVPVTVSDGIDESEAYLVMIDVTTVLGVDNDYIEQDFSIFPNPVTNLLTINTSSKVNSYQTKIFSLGGELVYISGNRSEDQTFIDLTKLSKGLYILQIASDRNIQRIKLLKQQ